MAGKKTTDEYYFLDPTHTDPQRMKKEREKAQKLRKTQWWLDQLNRGICHYCGLKYEAKQLTMDHIVPLARGGTSSQGNIVPSCRECNRDKKLETPAERLLKQLEEERKKSAGSSENDDSTQGNVGAQSKVGGHDHDGQNDGEGEGE